MSALKKENQQFKQKLAVFWVGLHLLKEVHHLASAWLWGQVGNAGDDVRC